MKKRILLIMLLLIAFVAIFFKSNIHGKVVCFGDSITYGALVEQHSWVWLLSSHHADVNFINAGRSGRKTTDKAELLPVLTQHSDADYYLIFLGVNDLEDGNDSIVNNCVANMKWMVDKIRKADGKANIVILAPSDINLKTMNEINVKKKYNANTQQSLKELEEKYKELSKEEHTGFISLLHIVSKSNYVDGLHPNPDGQKEIAKAVWKGLNKLY
jgi:acyl-CoA thioesterase-1